MSTRKGNTKTFTAMAVMLMRHHDWTIKDFVEYVQGPTFIKLRKQADEQIARQKERDERMKEFRIPSPKPLHAGPVWIVYSLWSLGMSEILEGEVIVGPCGGRKVRFSEPWFNVKGSTEYAKPPSCDRFRGCWIVASHPVFNIKEDAEACLNRLETQVSKHMPDNLPTDIKKLRRIAQDNHPDRNPDGDVGLYQQATAKLKLLRVSISQEAAWYCLMQAVVYSLNTTVYAVSVTGVYA